MSALPLFERSALVDLGSDTATRPTAGMKRAMSGAPTGDEQKAEDPTVCALEERVAGMLGMPRAMFVPSATMANQIAVAVQCGAGDEVICHRTAHVVNHEGGGLSIVARAQVRPLDTPRGQFGGDDVRRAVRTEDPHHPQTRLVIVENTSNGGGGTVWPLGVYDDVADACQAAGIGLHIDGARLWNAAARSATPLARIVRGATTVQLCFSKGLGCPFGAVLAMPEALWRPARRLKQTLGGSLRQAGVVAGAMLYALDHHLALLPADHARAATLAEGLAALPDVDVEPCETNLVFFTVRRPGFTPQAFCDALLHHGVRMSPAGPARIRAVTHLDVDDGGIDRALTAARAVLEAPAR